MLVRILVFEVDPADEDALAVDFTCHFSLVTRHGFCMLRAWKILINSANSFGCRKPLTNASASKPTA